MHSAVEKLDWTKVTFTSCHFQRRVELGKRTFKPQMFAGSLLGIRSLAGTCSCGKADHIPVVGKARSVESGHYSDELCEAYAELVIHHFRRLATAEFYAKREADLKREVEELRRKSTKRERSRSSAGDTKRPRVKTEKEEAEQAKAESTATSKSKARPKEEDEYTYEYETEDDEDAKVPVKTEKDDPKEAKAWIGGSGNYGMLRESKAKGNNPANLNYLGGMRNPTETVAGMPGSLNLGLRVFAAWERFVRRNPLAVETSSTYGTADCKMDRPTVDKWKAELRKLVGSQGKPTVDLQSRWR